jgi:hypothetical protein
MNDGTGLTMLPTVGSINMVHNDTTPFWFDSVDWGFCACSAWTFTPGETVVGRTFMINMSTSMSSSVGNTICHVMMYKNGVFEPGIKIERKVSTAGDVGALSVSGYFTLDDGDNIEVWVEGDNATTFTFYHTAINLIEIN